MISNTAKYHGAVFSSLVDSIEKGIHIRRLVKDASGFYIINDKLPVFLKYASKRHSPWTFTFFEEHLQQYYNLKDNYGECLVVLICSSDGIVTLGSSEMNCIINYEKGVQKRIGIKRKLNHMYRVNGSDGEINKCISKQSLSDIVINYVNGNKL